MFENLLASYNPETGATARKATGSFYTPREIVDYMVTSSLKNYLSDMIENHKLDSLLAYDHNLVELSEPDQKKLIDKLDALTIIDPAIGSGAFPMGLLHKITHLLGKIDPENKLWKQKLLNATPAALRSSVEKTLNNSNLDYARKLHLIQSTIYGVDIQPVAVQIAKLRFFISLVIEQNPNRDKSDNYGITALPNLETKFVCANSLIPLKTYDKSILTLEQINQAADTANNLFTNTDMFYGADIPSKEQALKENRERHFYADSREKKRVIIDTDKALRAELSELLIQNGMPVEQAGMLAAWNPYNPNQSAGFFDAEFMFGITKGFDIVIGNPPYIRQEKIKDIKPILQKSNYACYNGTADIYIYFFELGHKLLSDKGVLSYITSNKYTRANYGKEFRNFLLKQARLIEYIDFKGVAVFESATVDTSILSFSKQAATQETSFFYCSVEKDYTGDALAVYCAKKGFAYQQSDLVPEGFSFVNSQELAVKKQIERIGTPLKDWDIQIYRCILTGFNEAFIIDTSKRDELIAQDPKSAELIKPTLRGRDVKRYHYEWAGLWLINVHNNPPVNINNYLAIKAHLDLFYPQLEKRSDQGASPYNLRNCAYLQEFEKEKIVYPEFSSENCFSWDSKGLFTSDTAWIITNGSKYLTACFNSKVIWFYLKSEVASLGEASFRMKKFI